MSHPRNTVQSDENMAMHAVIAPSSTSQPCHSLRDVTNQNNALSQVISPDSSLQAELAIRKAWLAYRRRWSRKPRRRALWNHDRDAYYRAFWQNEERHDAIIEIGMAAFTLATQRLEPAVLNKDRTRPHVQAGRLALESLGRSLVEPKHSALDVVFVSIDFEGGHRDRGVTGFGATKCDSRLFCVSERPILQAENFRLRNRSKQNFIFGTTTSADYGNTRQVIISAIRTTTDGEQRNIVLVGHGLFSSEIFILKTLGITLEDLNVVGLIDTSALAQETLGIQGSLELLMQHLQIDHTRNTLHCAGNDAYYTMQVLLALLETMHFRTHPDSPRGAFEIVMEIVRRPLPQRRVGPPVGDEHASGREKSSSESIEGGDGLESGDLGALFG